MSAATTAARIKHVDPIRKRNPAYRGYAAFLGTPAGAWISENVAWKVDPYLMRLTRGKVGAAFPIPNGLLETRGARSGAVRRNGVIYFHDLDKVTVVASKLGADHHPGWYHNLRKGPDVTFNGVPMRAHVVEDEAELRRLWTLADRVYSPYAKYREQAARVGRTIPIVQLEPR